MKTKILKKPTLVTVMPATTAGKLITSWGETFNYQKDDMIIIDASDEKWCINRTIYNNTYIDASDWDTLYQKINKNLKTAITNIPVDNEIITKLFNYLKKNFIKKSPNSLIGMKKIIINDAIIANNDGEVNTPEGTITFNKDDFIVTGFANEQWPIKRKKINTEYFCGTTTLEIFNKFKNFLENEI